MKYKQTTSFLCALALSVAALAQPSGRQCWNKNWTFTKDGETRTLDLPHDWGVEQPFVQTNPGETGKLAWWGQATYSKALHVSADDLSRDLRLEVDGAFSNAKVYVNGAQAGGWPYGYASWAVELNPWLKPHRDQAGQQDRKLPLVSRRRPLPQRLAHPYGPHLRGPLGHLCEGRYPGNGDH